MSEERTVAIGSVLRAGRRSALPDVRLVVDSFVDELQQTRSEVAALRAQVERVAELALAAKAALPNAPYTGVSWSALLQVLSMPDLGPAPVVFVSDEGGRGAARSNPRRPRGTGEEQR